MTKGEIKVRADIDGVDTNLRIAYRNTDYGEDNDKGGTEWWVLEPDIMVEDLDYETVGLIEDKLYEALHDYDTE